MNWRWRLVRWWIRWNLERDGASEEAVQTALLYVAIGWQVQQLVKAGLDGQPAPASREGDR